MHSIGDYQLYILAFGSIGFGLVLLIKGGDWTVDAASWIAEKSGISKMFIAATVIAFGTSAPELFTSINANLSGFPGISLGNVLGSNVANILLVVGISALISPLVIERAKVRNDTIMMIGATLLLALGIYIGLFSRLAGIAMFLLLIFYIYYQYKKDNFEEAEIENDAFDSKSKAYLTLLGGFLAMTIGSEILVQGAVAGGIALDIDEAVIGLTVVAFGTSLPELSACAAAARKRQYDIILGGIIGSNVFNILSIVAVTAMIKPLIVQSNFIAIDLPVVLIVTALFAIALLISNKIPRFIGATFVASYLAFVSYQYIA